MWLQQMRHKLHEEVDVLAGEEMHTTPRTQRGVLDPSLVPKSPSYGHQDGWHKGTHGVSPPPQHRCSCHNAQPDFGNLSPCVAKIWWIQVAERLHDQSVMGPHSSSGGARAAPHQGSPAGTWACLCKHLLTQLVLSVGKQLQLGEEFINIKFLSIIKISIQDCQERSLT